MRSRGRSVPWFRIPWTPSRSSGGDPTYGFSDLAVNEMLPNAVMTPLERPDPPIPPLSAKSEEPAPQAKVETIRASRGRRRMSFFLFIKRLFIPVDAEDSAVPAGSGGAGGGVAVVARHGLVEGLEETLTPLLDFLGVGWDDGIRNYAETASRRGMINTPSYNQVTQPLYTRSRGRWERYAEQMQPVLPLLLPWVRPFGYGA